MARGMEFHGGMRIVVGSDGNERLVRNETAVDEGAIKSKDVQKPEEVTTLTPLGSPKTSTNKLNNEDEGLGEDLHDLLNDEGIPPDNRGNASPLPSLTGEDASYYSDNAVDYGTDGVTDDEDLQGVFEDDN